jgi:NAD(P)-dependent dehydrogenase (short-subunit alcohol dehydrogenase family)
MTKTAIITGAGRGIGRATAVALSELGYACVLIARSEADLQQTAALCNHTTFILPGDITDVRAIQQGVNATLEKFGRIDVLVNNAGVAPMGAFEQMTLDTIRQVIDVNLTAGIMLSQLVYPTMLTQKSGAIINVSSEAARDPLAGLAVYAAAKAGVNLFTKALAKEACAHGVRVYAVAPAGVETQMLRAIISKEQYPEEATLTPEDVAAVIVQCAAGDLWCASGETIYVHKKA